MIMYSLLYKWFQMLLVLHVINEVTSRVEFTNFVCTSMNKDLVDFDYCILKAVNRTYKYVSMKVIIYQKPITNMMVNIALYKRANGYKPFLYNISANFCKFLKNPKSNPVAQYFYSFINDISNLNQSCPFNDDIILEKLSVEMVNHRVTAILPFPEGEYMFKAIWTANNAATVVLKLYITLSSP